MIMAPSDEHHLKFSLLETPREIRNRIEREIDLNWSILHKAAAKSIGSSVGFTGNEPLQAAMLDLVITSSDGQMIPTATKSFVRILKKYTDYHCSDARSRSDGHLSDSPTIALYFCLHGVMVFSKLQPRTQPDGEWLDTNEAATVLLDIAAQCLVNIDLACMSTLEKRNCMQFLLTSLKQIIASYDQVRDYD